MTERKTLGQSSLEAWDQDAPTLDPREQGAWMSKDYVKEVEATVERGKKALPDQDFFVVVLQKKERLFQNVVRNYFLYRISCPTPNYDQIVYHYKHKTGDIELLWVLPARQICHDLLNNSVFLDPELFELFGYISDFKDKKLTKLAMKLNNEDEKVSNLVIEVIGE